MTSLLITGGAGFIGSHACSLFLSLGYQVVVIDNFTTGHRQALNSAIQVAGGQHTLHLIDGDVRSAADLDHAFTVASSPIQAVLHFAGCKSVSESFVNPTIYWDVNVAGTISLVSSMRRHNCRCLVFSSSATIYGDTDNIAIPESDPIRPISPYGHTKAVAEQFLDNVFRSEDGWRIAILRYFNPVGAHPCGLLGEHPRGIPTNLLPTIGRVAVGDQAELLIFGNTWPTKDGSCIRDYIHVMDLVDGHRATLRTLLVEDPQILTLNLGSGRGYSVLEVVNAFESISGQAIPYRVVERREGDIAISVADPTLAAQRIGWHTRYSLDEICRDGWAWLKAHPHGYGKE